MIFSPVLGLSGTHQAARDAATRRVARFVLLGVCELALLRLPVLPSAGVVFAGRGVSFLAVVFAVLLNRRCGVPFVLVPVKQGRLGRVVGFGGLLGLDFWLTSLTLSPSREVIMRECLLLGKHYFALVRKSLIINGR